MRLDLDGGGMMRKFAAAAALLFFGASQAHAVVVAGASTIRITAGPGADYLQIAEVIANDYDGLNVAPLASFSTLSVYPHATPNYYGPENLVDGVVANSDDLYHSGGTSPSEFVQLSFATPQDLSSLTLYGRVELATYRNIYNVEIRNASGDLLFSQTLDARGGPNLQGPATVTFDRVAAGVPEPGTWAMMLAGFGAAGVGMRRRRMQDMRVRHA